MEYQIPQFVDEETKFVGPFTLTQFWFLFAAGILSFFVWVLIGSFILKFFLIAIFFSIAALLAFGKMNGVPMYLIAGAAIRHFWLPKYYFWSRDIKESPNLLRNKKIAKTIKQNQPVANTYTPYINKNNSKDDINRIAQALDIKRKK